MDIEEPSCVYNAQNVMIGCARLGRVREQRPLSPRRSVIKPAGPDKTAGDRSAAYLTGGRDMGDQWGDKCRGAEEEMELGERWLLRSGSCYQADCGLFFQARNMPAPPSPLS